MEANSAQGEHAQSAISQRQSRQRCPFQSTPWFAHLMPPSQPMQQSLPHPPTPHTTSGGSSPLPCRIPVSHQTMKRPFCIPSSWARLTLMEALPGSPSPVPGKAGSHGRSPLPSFLLPPPDPLALPSPPVASDQRRTVSLNPPA